jgi:PAS domain S-box-containing protein
LRPAARSFLVATLVAAVVAGLLTLTASAPDGEDWLTFAAFAACAALAQHLIIPTGRSHGFPMAVVFLVASALLLPPQLVALMGIAQHVPDLIGRRYPGYITAFNTANYTLNALAAWAVVELVMSTGLEEGARWAVAGAAGAIVLVVLNHVLLAVMLRLGRGFSVLSSGLFSPGPVVADFALAGLGVILARFWISNPYLIPFAIAPLTLIQRSFRLVARVTDSEERFRAMFEGAPLGAAVTDLEQRIVASNRALVELLGHPESELAGRRIADLSPHDDTEPDAALYADLLAGRRDRYAFERRLLRQDGSAVLGQVSVSLVRDALDRPQFAIFMVEDLTESKQLEEQLRHAQKLEAVGQLAGGVAHDFNNLLTIITGRTRFALGHTASEAIRTDLEEVASAADRAAALTTQLLAFSRRQVMQPRVIEINTVVAGMDRMLRRLIGEDVEVATTFADDLGRVRADPGQLEQVILNLAVNARDAMPGGGRLTIETRNAHLGDSLHGADRRPEPGDYVRLTVTDTGHGMDERTRAHVFEPFFTTKEPGKGTGLGLSTVYGIVVQSGGYLAVESRVGEGSSFDVYLPRVEEEAAVSAVPAAVSPPARTGTETVLLVEDDGGVLAYADLVLTRNGYTVLTAAEGIDAIQIAERHAGPIHLLLTDVVMPRMSGPEVADSVARLRSGIRVLYMSGYAGESALPDPGGVALVAKPFDEETLLGTVRDVLDGPAHAAGRSVRASA